MEADSRLRKAPVNYEGESLEMKCDSVTFSRCIQNQVNVLLLHCRFKFQALVAGSF